MNTTEIDVDTLNQLLLMAFRYALGRRTAAVGYIADLLVTHRHHLADWQRQQILADIWRAIAAGHAGMDCDVTDWRRAAETLQ